MTLPQTTPLLILLLLAMAIPGLTGARELPPAARLSASGLAECWAAMGELRSCTNEIVLFFLNGESYLTLGCCRAIRLITHNCWPTMLSAIGFTSEEADILRGYCDAEIQTPPISNGGSLPPPPAVSPVGV